MPPVKASQKRKHTEAPTDTTDALEDENSAPSDASASSLDAARSAFLAASQQPCPVATHSGAGNAATAEGVVLRATKISVQGKTGTVPKMQVTVAVSKVSTAGGRDVVTAGIDGFWWCLPTKTIEPSPDDIARNKEAKGAVVLDVEDGQTRANFMGTFSCSFYIEQGQGYSGKGASAPAVDTCTPGTRVVISGLSCTYAKNGNGKLFTNAKKMVPISDPPASGKAAAAAIISEARSSSA